MALTDKLSAIGEAIREKTGNSELLTLDAMPGEIRGIQSGGGIPEEALKLTGNCQYRFDGNYGWTWFLDEYGSQITTEDITNANCMFRDAKVTEIPFDLNFKEGTPVTCDYMFNSCSYLTTIGKFKNFKPKTLSNMFRNATRLRYLPEFEGLDTGYINNNSAEMSHMFCQCHSLRRIDEDLLKRLYSCSTYRYSGQYYQSFWQCYTLDELKGLNFNPSIVWTDDMFYNTFDGNYRLKDVIFATNDDGTTKVAKWKNQLIELNSNIGYASNDFLHLNSGITADKEVKDDATYQALKNDPDWFTQKLEYSRYNHDSAVNTINSLPDTSAYLASNGGTNTIKFLGSAGSKTDGGAINTLTEAEIAVATAKGWTVTFV